MTAAASAGICAEANGLVRQQFAAVEAEHQRFIKAANALTPKLYGDLARGTTNTRNRAAAQIRAVLGVEPWLETNRAMIFRFARIIKQPLDDGRTHDGVELAFLCVGLSRGLAVVIDRPAALHVSWHAAGRLLERQGSHTDILATVIGCHDLLFAAPFAAFDTIHDNKIWSLPAAGGCFVADVHVVDTHDHADTMPFIRGRTYLSSDMLAPWQQAQCAAIRFRDDGPTLGTGLLMPMQLRAAAIPENGRVWLPRGRTEIPIPSRLRRTRHITGAPA